MGHCVEAGPGPGVRTSPHSPPLPLKASVCALTEVCLTGVCCVFFSPLLGLACVISFTTPKGNDPCKKGVNVVR